MLSHHGTLPKTPFLPDISGLFYGKCAWMPKTGSAFGIIRASAFFTLLYQHQRIILIAWHTLSPLEIERMANILSPGQWGVERARPLGTLLGSCVAVCLYDDIAGLGGMNHFMLPNMKSHAHGDVDALLSGDYAMEALLNGLLSQGALRHRVRAKAFGGGTIIGAMASSGIGLRNVEFAREWLDRENIPLLASDFLGPWSRKVLFVPATGDVFSKRIPTSMATVQEIAREEAAYAQSLQKHPPNTNVELF
jgi:chemotaxis protein CheD